jgi:hypothetical protein
MAVFAGVCCGQGIREELLRRGAPFFSPTDSSQQEQERDILNIFVSVCLVYKGKGVDVQ